jgi:PAS domain S-box-containing protein
MNDQDKTKQQLVEEVAELRQSLDVLINNLPEGFLIVDSPDAEIRLASRYGAEMLAVSPQELQGIRGEEHFRYYEAYFPDGVPAKVEQLPLARALLSGEVIRNEEWLLQVTDGRRIPIICQAGPVCEQHGTITGAVISWQDITDRKRAEGALRENERRFRSLFQDSSVGAVVVTPNGQFIQVNRAFCDFLGYSEAELVGQTVLSVTHPEDREASSTAIRQAAESVARIQRLEKRYLHKSGQVVWGEVSSALICDAEGKPSYFITQVLNITERKQAEEALKKAHNELEARVKERTAELREANERLQQSHEELRVIYDGMVDGLLVTDSETKRFMRANASICRMLGYSETELLSMSVKDLHPAEALPHILERIDSIKETKQPPPRDIPFLRKDGSVFYVEVVSKFLIYNGRPCSMGIFRDVTERKQAEEALAESEAKYRQLVETTDTGYLILDGEGLVVDANREYVRISGHHDLAEIIGHSVVEWTAPYDKARNAQEVGQCVETGRVRQLEIDYTGPDGAVTPIEINANVITSKEGQRIVSLCRDITERRQAQEAIRQGRDELQTIYDQAVEGIIIVDAKKMNLVRTNSAYCRMVGYFGEEVYSMSPERLHPPEVLPAVLAHLDAVKKGNVARIDDLLFVRKDGGAVYADVVSSPIHYNGRPCWISFFHDVTERKQTRDALERERQSLWRMLQASDHERQTISYDIHDGLAQYLAAAVMQFQAHDTLRENSPDKAKTAYETAVELVRQAHSESRRLISEVRHPVIDESGLETAISHLVHEQRQRGGPKIEYHSSVQFGRLPPILENALYRIVQEALTNACKHSKSQKVTVSVTQEGEDVRLEVRDWGIGFDQEAVGKGHFGVEGIRQRVRLLGGRLTIESKPGSGTLVQVVVPILETHSKE